MAIKVEKKTGVPELDAIIAATSNKFGVDMSGADYGDIEVLSTGSLQLDLALVSGGIPLGRVTEILGQESSMKTTFALSLIAKRQKDPRRPEKRFDLLIDLEHSLTHSFIEGFGIDMDQVIWLRPSCAEEALQIAVDYPKSGAIDTVLIDSVDAMQSDKQQRRAIGETDVGGISKEMSHAMRMISKIAPQQNTTYFFINQIRMKPGITFGNPETTPGGLALAFYSTLRLKCMQRKEIPDIPNATLFRVKVVKNKMGGDATKIIEIPFEYGKGVITGLDLETVAKDLGILRYSAGQAKIIPEPDAEPIPLLPDIERGKAAARELLMADEKVQEMVRNACMKHLE